MFSMRHIVKKCQETGRFFKMKEMWFYLHPIFTDGKKYFKKIKKCEKCVVYESVVKELFLKETVQGK